MTTLSFLPYLPLDPSWIEQHPAFHDEDPVLAKALMKLLLAAWRGSPVGSIPASQSYLADVTGLGLEHIARVSTLLTQGFQLREDGRLYHAHLAKLADTLSSTHGKALESFRTSWAMTMQAPDEFGMACVESTLTKKPRGKTTMPKGFGYDMYPGLRTWAAENGYPDRGAQDYVMSKFIDYCAARGERNKKWDAAFRTWALNEISFGRFPPGSAVATRGLSGAQRPFGGLVRPQMSKGERASAHNVSALAHAERLMSGNSAPQGDFIDAMSEGRA